MSKSGFVVGMVAGLAVGVGSVVFVNQIDDRDKKRLKKNASRLFTTLGAVADRVVDIND